MCHNVEQHETSSPVLEHLCSRFQLLGLKGSSSQGENRPDPAAPCAGGLWPRVVHCVALVGVHKGVPVLVLEQGEEVLVLYQPGGHQRVCHMGGRGVQPAHGLNL